MRKKIIPSFLLLIAVTSFSCEKIEESSPVTINTSKTANISGGVKANLVVDKVYIEDWFGLNATFTKNDTLERVPEGTEIHFRVSKNEYNPSIPADQMVRFSTTVNANGRYSINIPTTDEGVNVEISFDEFASNKITWRHDSIVNINGVPTDYYSSYNSYLIYNIPVSNSISVHTDENKFLNFIYN